MPAPSLRQLATATAIRHVRYLDDIGNMPYSLARPILLKVDNPEKLHCIELSSPHIAEEDEELWLEFIKRDIPQWDTYELPEKSNRWYEIYCDLREEVQRSLEADAEKMKMAIEGINSERKRLTPKIVSEPRSARLPRLRPSLKQRYVSYDRKMGGLTPVFAKPTGASDPLSTPSWTFQPPAIPRSELSAPAAKKKPTIFAPQRRNRALAVPTKHLHTRATQIKQAPRALIEEHRRPAEQPASRRKDVPGPITPLQSKLRDSSTSSISPSDTKGPSLTEREARLRALTCGNPPPSGTNDAQNASPPTKAVSPPTTKSGQKRSAVSPPPQNAPSPPSRSSPQSPNRDSRGAVKPDEEPVTPAARPAVIRKRPAPSIFIQPKRKRVS